MYSREELLSIGLSCCGSAPSRPVRKILFIWSLWSPVYFRRLCGARMRLSLSLNAITVDNGITTTVTAAAAAENHSQSNVLPIIRPNSAAVQVRSTSTLDLIEDSQTVDVPTHVSLGHAGHTSNTSTSVLSTTQLEHNVTLNNDCFIHAPSLLVLNPTSLAKADAIDQLLIDVTSFKTDIAIISETWFKKHHLPMHSTLPNYITYRLDRKKRRGGGVAIFVTDKVLSKQCVFNSVDERFELLWIETKIKTRTCIVGALYHPPNPLYPTKDLVSNIETTLDELHILYPQHVVILAGDFNQLLDSEICNIGLISVDIGATHRGHALDRIYTSEPLYSSTKIVNSTIKTAHKTVIAHANQCSIVDHNKINTICTVRSRTPRQHALLLSKMRFIDWSIVTSVSNVQIAFDIFYDLLTSLLNEIYPKRTVTLTSRDPPFVTPHIKRMLRAKNKLLKNGQVQEAEALTLRIGKEIAKYNSASLSDVQSNEGGSKEMWSKVRQLTDKRPGVHIGAHITAESLNVHYATISTDDKFVVPAVKSTVNCCKTLLNEYSVFRALDTLKATSEGPDGLPFWFLKLCSNFIALPFAYLCNISLIESTVPTQWKTVQITPIPKISQPKTCSDFRPISISSILSRVMERLVVHAFLYPVISMSGSSNQFNDQFAFRPTGSTTAALSAILHLITNMLVTNPYVHLIAFDMSKAFDTVRHETLMEKMAGLPIPDNVYNWINNFLCDRSHCTKLSGIISSSLFISASVIQGSALGPAAFIINASDIFVTTDGNIFVKYADDFYLIVPAINTYSIQSEINHLSQWALNNNLKLNDSKSCELIICTRGTPLATLPPIVSTLTRNTSMKVLGVTLDSHLTFSVHVSAIVALGAQSLYAIKTLKSHGLQGNELFNVCRSTLVAKLTYASSSWWGFCTASDKLKLQGVLSKAIRWGLYSTNMPNINQIIDKADSTLFQNVLSNSSHVLHQFLPPNQTHSYSLRSRPHDRQLSISSTLQSRNFLHRMLHLNMY